MTSLMMALVENDPWPQSWPNTKMEANRVPFVNTGFNDESTISQIWYNNTGLYLLTDACTVEMTWS